MEFRVLRSRHLSWLNIPGGIEYGEMAFSTSQASTFPQTAPLMLKYPLPQAKKPFKCPILGSFCKPSFNIHPGSPNKVQIAPSPSLKAVQMPHRRSTLPQPQENPVSLVTRSYEVRCLACT